MFYGVKDGGILYYDSRYDYTKIIDELITDTNGTWTAVAV
jgi:hypothetical protein